MLHPFKLPRFCCLYNTQHSCLTAQLLNWTPVHCFESITHDVIVGTPCPSPPASLFGQYAAVLERCISGWAANHEDLQGRLASDTTMA